MNSDLPLGKTGGLAGLRGRRLNRKALVLLGAAFLSLFVGYAGYSRFLGAAQPAAPVQTAAARSGSLVSTVTATGSIVATRQAKLSFSAAGKLAEMGVAIGDSVKAGRPLARLDQQPLQLKLAQSESSLRVARIKLQQLRDGATPEEIAAAKAAYASAVASYEKVTGSADSDRQSAQLAVDQATQALASAQATLEKVKAGPTQADLTAAQATLDQAKAGYAAAQAKLEQLKAGPTQVDVATATSSVESTRATLKSAQTRVDQIVAGNNQTVLDIQSQLYAVNRAYADLLSAQDDYESWKNGERVSGVSSNSQMAEIVHSAQLNYDVQVAKLNQMKANAPTELVAARDSLASAQAAFNAANAKLDLLKQGTLPADLASGQSAFDGARATLSTAQAKLDLLTQSPTAADLADAQAKVDQAQINLLAAQTKLSDAEAGAKNTQLASAESSLASARSVLAAKANPPKVTDLALQEEQVAQAEITVKQAQTDLQGAVIVAPFDGVVSATTGNVGEQVGSSAAVVTMVDPKSIRVDVTVDETDVAKLVAGQAAQIGFDALPDLRLQGKVSGVAPAGTTTQGVVSYLVSVAVNNPGRMLPTGMSASATIETERKDNVLLVPNRAVKTVGRNKTVEVVTGGKTQTRTVQTGSANDQMTEITSGLQEGELVVIPSTTIRSSMTTGGGMGGPAGPAPVLKTR